MDSIIDLKTHLEHPMNMREIGRERGRKAAQQAKANKLHEVVPREFKLNGELFPTLGKNFDFAAAVLAWDKKRIEDTPDFTKFPEMRGLPERVLGEREGFLEGSGFTELHAAFHYSFHHYIWKHVNAHHVARYDLAAARSQCTNVFFPHGLDGVTVSDNRDDVPNPWYVHVPAFRIGPVKKNNTVHWGQGGVSSAVLLDEEPTCKFPYNPFEHIPPECLDNIHDLVTFMSERRDFWGPGNQMWVDKQLRAVAIEKANVRMAARYPTVSGACCITACSYLNPELNAFKRSRLIEVAKHKGEKPEECIDLIFSDGCDLRHQRLWDLTNAEAGRPGGATLLGAFNVVADTGVPFPARVCLAGEKCDPKREPNANWTLTQHAIVLTGENRRALYRSIQDIANPKPITTYKPKLSLGEGVAMKPEWQREIDHGLYELADEPVAASA